jgi:predicted Zn-dependent protease
VLPVSPVTDATMRINRHTGQRQLLTRDLLALLADQRPAGARCVVGITMDDLYPDPAWNFVFGEASPRDRVGVYSFARYLPRETGAAASSLLLRPSCKVLAHETAHLLGIAHCVFYSCLMNGSNHLAESDARRCTPALLTCASSCTASASMSPTATGASVRSPKTLIRRDHDAGHGRAHRGQRGLACRRRLPGRTVSAGSR